jgi:hypothetical protein
MSDAPLPATDRPRYCGEPLPRYSYVPGVTPHPVSDPRGHMHGVSHPPAAALDPAAWRGSPPYLYGVDLFNHGYYWEAHEAWESLWHVAGRNGPVADWLKALIKLAAAAVKAREGNAAGVTRHANRAAALVAAVRLHLPPVAETYCGASLAAVERISSTVAEEAGEFTTLQPTLLLPQWIGLHGG